ncbi:MAG: hypothetical protein U1E50_09825 [Caulobacteraceae bacterium]
MDFAIESAHSVAGVSHGQLLAAIDCLIEGLICAALAMAGLCLVVLLV